MNLAKTAAGTGLALAACAACCAPLIAPPVIGLIAAGGAGLALAGQIGLALAIVAGASAYIWWEHRRAAHVANQVTASACACEGDEACSSGEACALPQSVPAATTTKSCSC